MKNVEKQSGEETGAMRKRRETMPDGKRYIIFYTFGENAKSGGAPLINEFPAGQADENEVKADV